METTNKFKVDFKYYKQKCPPPDYSNVIEFSNDKDLGRLQRVKPSQPVIDKLNPEEVHVASLMIPPSEWCIYELLDKPGLLFVNNPFTAIGQRYWIYRCLRDYTRRPNRLNIDAHNVLEKSQDWWDMCQRDDHLNQSLMKKLRWATLGYHHNWDTKAYSENMKDPFPSDLAALSRYVCHILYGQEDFSAEAAIVNFYHFDSTLSGHTDHSEMDMSAPLLSFSFGQTAIFLLGGTSLDVTPTPMYIESGDIVIMSKESRQCYHGIPKIVPAMKSPWNTGLPLKCGDEEPPSKRARDTIDREACSVKSARSPFSSSGMMEELLEEEFWEPFQNYIKQSRINMNVRQVLCKGEKTLNNKGS
ncbi:hypothetical protein ONE63_010009 [Megalurothrips usitatus]|uniref:Alpha-ketoglutarate-dependent dioxygenase AlkB-like domain-containing protein n=1 Tax=Megalurothrips usitatus TaxID=439358 RepID=A0AAV7XGG4_9NEOP|nr:hypothetical protein ONE63_010009 [Megalurothrips usitatus]